MGFSRKEYWSGLPCPPPGGLPDPGIEPTSLMSPVWQVGSLPLEPPGKPVCEYISTVNTVRVRVGSSSNLSTAKDENIYCYYNEK